MPLLHRILFSFSSLCTISSEEIDSLYNWIVGPFGAVWVCEIDRNERVFSVFEMRKVIITKVDKEVDESRALCRLTNDKWTPHHLCWRIILAFFLVWVCVCALFSLHVYHHHQFQLFRFAKTITVIIYWFRCSVCRFFFISVVIAIDLIIVLSIVR